MPIQSTESTSKPKSKKSGSESRSSKARSFDKTESKQSKLNADGSIHATSTSPTNNRLRYRFRDSWFTDQDYKDLNFNFPRNQRRMTKAVTGHAKCIPRNTTIVADIGVISGHFKTLDHLNNVTKYTLGSKQPKISSFTIKNTNDGVARAQILLSTFLATKHIPISVSKGLIDVCRLPSIQNPCPKPS